MLLFKKVQDLKNWLSHQRDQGLNIGFVPTMGALHKGHLSLIHRSRQQSKHTVCSIFVNPTQFNDASDLAKYPRTITNDIQMLTSAGNDVLFLPDVAEVYPPGLDTRLSVSFAPLDQVMEGRFRPGHFDGMAQVVKRLLDIVEPDSLYMGQKDFQQFAIVRSMIRQLGLHLKLVMCPIIREADGLAMSSRNRRLPAKIRRRATILYHTLLEAKEKSKLWQVADICAWAIQNISIPDFRPEYFEVVDGNTLQPIASFQDTDFAVACVAAWAGEVRLIDNMVLKEASQNA